MKKRRTQSKPIKNYKDYATFAVYQDMEHTNATGETNALNVEKMDIVKDSQYRQRTEALRLVRRIRAKQYLLLKLGNYLLQRGLYIPC
jgi:hypothetical protein